MKLLNYTSSYFAIVLLFLITIWAGIFYFAMLDEIYDSIDDGLDNRKGLIIQKAVNDSTLLPKTTFGEGDFTIFEINAGEAKNFHDVYRDTSMFMQNEQDFEPVRLLRTVFYHNSKYYQMEIVTSMVEEDDLVSTLWRALIWLYVGLVSSILVLNNILLKRIWRPFYHLLKGQGFIDIDSFDNPEAFIFIYQKDNVSGFQPKSTFSQSLYDKITLAADCPSTDTIGYITSPVFGPAKAWQQLRWNGIGETDPGDR